jgi:phospholipase C
MPSRRQFLRAAASSGAAGLFGVFPAAIRRAVAIDPEPGSTALDAEHVVVLMQENRSFDHAFGTLRGVRGFNDPRAVTLPNGNPVWAQSNAAGETYVPFRLDIKESKTTWMGSLPHGWADQVDAANGGKHDRWLDVKKSGNKAYATMPLTLGYHTRADVPFYYALADAFTICDQHFCSTLTGTTPNRLHLWTGTIRAKPTPDTPALVRNEDCDYGKWQTWTTFPERLEDYGVSWKIYQNELTVPSGLTTEEDAWLSNFGCSPIEWFTQFHVRHAPNHRAYLAKRIETIPKEIEQLQKQHETATGLAAERLRKRIDDLKALAERLKSDRAEFTAENFEKLTPRQKSLFARAFVTNVGDPDYRSLEDFTYRDGEATRRLKLPKGDVLHQFRKDVATGQLPTVSWIVPPEKWSDHPTSAWYGQWYLSEVMNILTKNPAVWKKTVFILTYDENDGYFDHVPPFQAPHPTKPDTGKASKGIDTALDHLDLAADRRHKPTGAVRGNSLGLGFRVPMVIASPWSRGGCVCSQVFDHTSVIRFMEKFASHNTGKKVEEPNITAWRRTVCGDLTSAFRSPADADPGLKDFLARGPFVESIHKAQFKALPTGYKPLTPDDVARIKRDPKDPQMPRQEPGVRPSSPLPYELEVEGGLNAAKTAFVVHFAAKNEKFGANAAGTPFTAYAVTANGTTVRHYAVTAGDRLDDAWPLDAFADGKYLVRVHGPNGFYREFAGGRTDPDLHVRLIESSSEAVTVHVTNVHPRRPYRIEVRDRTYGGSGVTGTVPPSGTVAWPIDLSASRGWYDLAVTVDGAGAFERRFAGRVETGRWGISDPAMAGTSG